MTTRLYHLTAEPWWMLIAMQGEIISFAEKRRRGQRDGDRIGAYTVNSAPVANKWDEFIDGFVWLTENAAPRQQWQTPVEGETGKGAIRIEVDRELIPDLRPWRITARQAGMPRILYDALDATGQRQSNMWWVTPGPIPMEAWVEVVRTAEASVLWNRALDAVV